MTFCGRIQSFFGYLNYLASYSSTTGEGCSLPNSPSQRAITTVSRQLPITFTEVRAALKRR